MHTTCENQMLVLKQPWLHYYRLENQERHGCFEVWFSSGDQLWVKLQGKQISPWLYCGLYLCKKKFSVCLEQYKKTPHFFYVRVKFWSQIIRNRLFIDVNYQWLCKYGEDWGQSVTVGLSSHWRMWQCDSCQSCDCSISASSTSLGWYYYLRITRDRKGTDLQWRKSQCSIALVSKPYLVLKAMWRSFWFI